MSDVVEPDATPTAEAPSFMMLVLTRFVVPVLIIGAGILCMGTLVSLRPSAKRSAPEASVPQVIVVPLEAKTVPATIAGSGVVTPAQQVRLLPEVSGRVVWQSDALIPGAHIQKGDLLARLDGRDYTTAVAQQERAVEAAKLELQLEQNRGKVAKREWGLLGDTKQQDASLALREPHLRTAQKSLLAAEAALSQAKANLGRTRITAPFNGVLLDENIDLGQVVGPTAAVATLVGTDTLRVQVSLPVEKLAGIDFPRPGRPVGSAARIEQTLGAGQQVVREGAVIQLMGQLDPQTRTAQVLVEIPDPFEGDGIPLLPGAWVNVTVDGKALSDTWTVPRASLVKGQYVWVVDQENGLHRRTVQVGWREQDSVVLTAGIEEGDRLVTSPLTLPVEGQPVEVTEQREDG